MREAQLHPRHGKLQVWELPDTEYFQFITYLNHEVPECTAVVIRNNRKSPESLLWILYFCKGSHYQGLDLPRQKEYTPLQYFRRGVPFPKNHTLYLIFTLHSTMEKPKRTVVAVLTELKILHIRIMLWGCQNPRLLSPIVISIVFKLSPFSNLIPLRNIFYNTGLYIIGAQYICETNKV